MTSQLQTNNLESSIKNDDSKIEQENSEKSKFNTTPPTAHKYQDQQSDQVLVKMQQRYRQIKEQQQKQKQFNEIRDKFNQKIQKKQNQIYLLGRQIFELSYKKSEEVPSLKKKLIEANIQHHQLLKDKHNQLLKKKYFSGEQTSNSNLRTKIDFKEQINVSQTNQSSKKFNYFQNRQDLIKSDLYDIKYPLSYILFETQMKFISNHENSLKIQHQILSKEANLQIDQQNQQQDSYTDQPQQKKKDTNQSKNASN